MRRPLVSIGLPVFNGENFLEEALRSILAQSYDHLELIVSDNASTDRTPEIVGDYESLDRRVRVVSQPRNIGPAANFRWVLEEARGAFFKWAAHDDVLAPSLLERCLPILGRDRSVVVSYGRSTYIDADGTALSEPEMPPHTDSPDVVRRIRSVITPTYLHQIFGVIRTDALKACPPMGAFAHADGVLLLQLALLGRFEEVPATLLFVRLHEAQSMQIVRANYREYSGWWAPENQGKTFFPWWRIASEFARTLAVGPISAREKADAFRLLARWTWQVRRELIGDVEEASKASLRSTPVGHRLVEAIKRSRLNWRADSRGGEGAP